MDDISQGVVQSILSDMTSIRCTLGTPEIPKLASLYRPLIVRCARSIELLSHLNDAIDDGTCTVVLDNSVSWFQTTRLVLNRFLKRYNSP